MDHNDIQKLVELMDKHGLSHFVLEQDDFSIELKKGNDLEAAKEILASLPTMSAAPAAAPALAPATIATAAAPVTPVAPVADGEEISSPMVGTFYTKPSPDADNFVSVGDQVSEGQTICIIEAMKVMNEIKAETSGTITEICVDDATPVQYGDALFRIK